MYRLPTLLCVSVLALAAVQAPARADKLGNVIALEINAQPIEASLIEFSRQAGLQLVIQTGALPVRTAPRISGSMKIDAALKLLLSNTDLSYKIVGNRTLTIISPRDAGASRETAGTPVAARLQLASAETSPDTTTDENAKARKEAADDEIVVNSTRETGVVNQGIIPREENQAVRYTIIRREDIERSGVTSLPELMRRLSVNGQAGTTSQLTMGYSLLSSGNYLTAGDQVNLRSFGWGQTLVMINGRRLYGALGDGTGADISRIPLSAVERIEVLPSSGSAVYGANSMGGVINVVMRKGYSGTEVSSYLGAADGGAEESRYDLFHGMSFNGGRTTLSLGLNYQRQHELLQGKRDFYERVIDNPGLQPPSDNYISKIMPYFVGSRAIFYSWQGLGIPSDPTAQFAVVPAGTSGIGLTPASFNATAGVGDTSTSRTDRVRILPESRSYSALLNLEHAFLGDALGGYAELTYRESHIDHYYPGVNTFLYLVSDTDPNNPFRTDVTPGFEGRDLQVYRAVDDLPDSSQTTERVTLRAVTGLKGKWSAGGRSFNWALDGSWDDNRTRLRAVSTAAGVRPAAYAGIYNFYRDLTGTSMLPASEAAKYALETRSTYEPSLIAGNFRLNGDLFPVWGGPAKFSFGMERRREDYRTKTWYPFIGEYNYLPLGAGAFVATTTTDQLDRNVYAAYGEAVFPLVGQANRRPGLYSLDLSAGMRYEKYSDFEAAQPPLLALKYGVTPDFALRAAYAEGFQPPSLVALHGQGYSNAYPAGWYSDPLRPGLPTPGYNDNRVGNPGLNPETAQTWDIGMILTPRALPGLTANVSYFRYDKKDVVATVTLSDAILLFPQLVIRAPASAEDIAAGRPGPVTDFQDMSVNIARQFTDGLDLKIRYDFPARGWGQVSLLSDGTWTRRFLSQSIPTRPAVDSLGLLTGTVNAPIRWRANSTLLWTRGAVTASWLAHYTSPFETGTTTATTRNPLGLGIDGDRIDANFTMDAQLSYTMPQSSAAGWRGWLDGVKWTAGANNFLNQEPPVWSDPFYVYSQFADPRQRVVYFQINKSF